MSSCFGAPERRHLHGIVRLAAADIVAIASSVPGEAAAEERTFVSDLSTARDALTDVAGTSDYYCVRT